MRGIFHLLNGLYPTLNFTVEEERDSSSKLLFADVFVEHDTDGFQWPVYRNQILLVSTSDGTPVCQPVKKPV